MNLFRAMWRRMILLLRSGRLDRDMDEELRFHLERQTDDNIKKGMAPREARFAALRAFGGVEPIKEECRDARGLRFLDELWQDLRYGLRMLRKSPGFTFVAVVTLALGIGANTAIFTLLDAVLLRMLPVENPREIVLLSQRVESRQDFPFATYQYQGLQEDREVLSGLCAFRPWPGFRVDVNGEAQLAFGQLVSGNYYAVLGVHAVMGRTLADDDDKAPGQHPVAVISYAYWQKRFGGDLNIVGQKIELRGQPFTIVGVTPRDFFGTEPGRAVEITVPLAMLPVVMPEMSRLTESKGLWLMLLGRLKRGVSAEQARARLNLLWAQLLAPESQGREQRAPRLELQSGAQGLNRLREQFFVPLRILMAAVGVVLLLACANLAGLLLARAMARRHEIEVRLALGAGRSRVARQLLTESVLLAIPGGMAGATLAYWGTDLMISMMSRGTAPIVLSLAPDLRVMSFTGTVTILTGLLFGVLPAVRVTRGAVHPGLKGNAPGVPGPRNRWAQTIMVFQVALSLLLLSSAALFMRTLRNLHVVDAGFRKDRVLLVSVEPGASGYRGDRARALYKELYAGFSSTPGVTAVTFSMDTPLGGLSYAARISVPGRSPDKDDDKVPVYFNFVGPRFFEVLGTPILSGRDFNDGDDRRALSVAVINESLARRYFRDDKPLGRRVLIGKEPVEIVGVAKDARYESLREPAPQMIYRPSTPSDDGMTFCIRTAGDSLTLVPILRSEARAVARNLPIHSVRTLEQQVDAALVQERMMATLSSFFGLLAIILASIGLYGTMAYAAVQRTREIGLRMALGARPVDVLRLVLGGAMRLVLSGLALGVPATWIAARLGSHLISGLLFEVKPTDPLAVAMAVLLLFAMACIAGYLPARRASKVDPILALRYE